MAITSVCGLLINGQDASCVAPVRRFYQQAVLINFGDIDPNSVVTISNVQTLGVCDYNVQFSLKEGKSGVRFTGSEKGSSFKGYIEKTVSEFGIPQYKHNVQILISEAGQSSKCILDSLSKGKFVAVLQLVDGTVEVYGLRYGLSTADFTYDLQESGGGTAIVLSSLENSPENNLPYVYKSSVIGGENADFDSNFANL